MDSLYCNSILLKRSWKMLKSNEFIKGTYEAYFMCFIRLSIIELRRYLYLYFISYYTFYVNDYPL